MSDSSSLPFWPLPPQPAVPLFLPVHIHQYSLARVKLPCPVAHCSWGKPHIGVVYSA